MRIKLIKFNNKAFLHHPSLNKETTNFELSYFKEKKHFNLDFNNTKDIIEIINKSKKDGLDLICIQNIANKKSVSNLINLLSLYCSSEDLYQRYFMNNDCSWNLFLYIGTFERKNLIIHELSSLRNIKKNNKLISNNIINLKSKLYSRNTHEENNFFNIYYLDKVTDIDYLNSIIKRDMYFNKYKKNIIFSNYLLNCDFEFKLNRSNYYINSDYHVEMNSSKHKHFELIEIE